MPRPSKISRLGRSVRHALHVLSKPVRRTTTAKALVIQGYRGYGSARRLCLDGRIYRQPGTNYARSGPWRDLIDLWRRVLRTGEAGVSLKARFRDNEQRLSTDAAGYFRVDLRLTEAVPENLLWHRVILEAASEQQNTEPCMGTSVDVFVPPVASRFVVISDIDDTVMYTGVANKLRMIWSLFFLGAQSRVAFPGVAAFYRALHAGAEKNEANPMLYVSRGPWSLYEVLEEFFTIHDFPVGPILFLRDWGLTAKRFLPRRAKGHKLELIRRMLTVYAEWPFILIGDSGQHDPDIYAQIVRENPGRVKVIYIRNISSNPSRTEEIETLATEVTAAGSELLLSADTVVMAEHAAGRGLIDSEALMEVRGGKRSDFSQALAGESEEISKSAEPTEVKEVLEEEGADGKPPNVVVSGDANDASPWRED